MLETDDRGGEHELTVEPQGETTHAECSCGHWARDAGADTIAVTGRSREEALRNAHELHARGLTA